MGGEVRVPREALETVLQPERFVQGDLPGEVLGVCAHCHWHGEHKPDCPVPTLQAALRAAPAAAGAEAGAEANTLYLNDEVKVQLSEVGIRRLSEYYAWLRSDLPETAHKYLRVPQAGEDGMLRFQVWDLLNIFGPACGAGRAFPFERGLIHLAHPAPAGAPAEGDGGAG